MKVGFVHKYWLEDLVVILVKKETKHNRFIVVRSSLTYIHYLDQPSQGFNQFTKILKWKQNNFHLQITRWANPSSIPYKPKELSNSCQRKDKNEKYVMITNWSDYTSFSLLQITSLKDRENMFLKFIKERDDDLIDFRS